MESQSVNALRHLKVQGLARLLSFGTLLFLAGCGGGGGGASSGATGTTLAINDANARPATRSVLDVTLALLGGSFDPRLVATSTPTKSADPALRMAVFGLVRRVADATSSSSAGFGRAAVSSGTFACSGGGSLSGTVNDADNSLDLSAGDVISLVASGCVEEGLTMNGGFSMRISLLNGALDGPSFVFGVETVYTGLSITDGAVTVTAAGDMTARLELIANAQLVFNISGSSLELGVNGRSHLLTNYALNTVETLSIGLLTITGSGTFDLPQLGGSVFGEVVNEVQWFPQIFVDAPHDGLIRILGSGDTRIELDIIDQVSVRLTVDDGVTTPTSVQVNWVDIF